MNEHMKWLGLKAEDIVTGFKGIVTSVSFDLYGCIQILVTPTLVKEDKIESYWFDAKRLKILSSKPVMTVPSFTKAGVIGPEKKPHFSRQPLPRR